MDSSKGIVYLKEYIPSKILKSLNPNDRNKIKTFDSFDDLNTYERILNENKNWSHDWRKLN